MNTGDNITGANVFRKMRKQALSKEQLILLGFCLVFPVVAAIEITKVFDWRFLSSYVVVISGIAYISCRSDKMKAQADAWRTPESTLHLLELLGGWPGSFIAQRRFRHKISKVSYQMKFWLIVVLYQAVSLDYLFG